MLSTRILLPILVLAIVPSKAAIAYDIDGDWSENQTKITKEEKRRTKGLFKHHKVAEAKKSANQPAATAVPSDKNAAPTKLTAQSQN